MRKLALACVVAALVLSLAGCSDAMAKKIFMYGFEKAIGGDPDPIELEEPITVTVNVSVKIGKTPETLASPFVPAYPQRVLMKLYQATIKDEQVSGIIRKYELEKWTDKSGVVSASATFTRLFPDEFIILEYWDPARPHAPAYRLDGQLRPGGVKPAWVINYAAIVTSETSDPFDFYGGNMKARYSETNKRYYMDITDLLYLGMPEATTK